MLRLALDDGELEPDTVLVTAVGILISQVDQEDPALTINEHWTCLYRPLLAPIDIYPHIPIQPIGLSPAT